MGYEQQIESLVKKRPTIRLVRNEAGRFVPNENLIRELKKQNRGNHIKRIDSKGCITIYVNNREECFAIYTYNKKTGWLIESIRDAGEEYIQTIYYYSKKKENTILLSESINGEEYEAEYDEDNYLGKIKATPANKVV